MSENDQSNVYLQRQLSDARRQLKAYEDEARQRDRVQCEQILADEAALAVVTEQRQTQERQDIQEAEVQAWRRSCWISHHITTAPAYLGPSTVFSDSYLGPLTNESMSNPLNWAPGSSASDVTHAHVLRHENPIDHVGEEPTRFSKMLAALVNK